MFDKSGAVAIVHMDFSKAFDQVPHVRLIQKIKAQSLQGILIDWIQI